jgi:glycosyltransferase involved in cell wall biosynthesis
MLAGKKIIFLLGSMELGGAERQALYLAMYLSEHEHAMVEFWGLGALGRLTQICDEFGIPWKNHSIRFGFGLVRDFTELLRLSRLIYRSAPDVLMPYTWFPNVLSGLIWRISGCHTCIWNQRDSGVSLDPTRAIHRLAVYLTPFFISNSTHAAAFIMDRFGVNQEHVVVIPNGVRLDPPRDNRHTWRLQLGVEDNDFVGCMVANFSQLKDHVTAVRAWRLVVDKLDIYGRRAMLVLAGRDDGTVKSINSLIRKLNLEKNVCILDSVDDVSGLLASCDVGVHCSEHEGCPNAVLEEMLAGLPVVATYNDGSRKVLGVGADAFLAQHQNSDDIAQSIINLAIDNDYRVKVGNLNKQRALEMFGVEAMCSETTKFIVHTLRDKNHKE